MQKIMNLKKWVEDYETLSSKQQDLEVLIEFQKAGEVSEEEVDQNFEEVFDLLESIEFRNMLSNEGDSLSAVLQITAGAGGTESCDWAEMLMRMYIMWAEKNKFSVKELNHQVGDVAGVKSVTLEINGEFGFGWLKGENGVHRLREYLLLTAMLKDIPLLPLFMYIHWLMIQLKSLLIHLKFLGKQ